MNVKKLVFQGMLFAIMMVSGVHVLWAQNNSSAVAQSPSGANSQAAASSSKPPAGHYAPNQHPLKEQMYYLSVWGVEDLKVKYTESGEMIRFSYRVVDPRRAAPLNDKMAEPGLYAPSSRVKLAVPQMEKVGKLRQTSTPIEGKSYWMAFANPGRRVRPGDRVSVEIGNFRAINLLVE
jgi:hypothetical protein